MARFTDKVVFITGAASGLGNATARQLAAEGAMVYGTGRNSEGLEELKQAVEKSAGRISTAQLDVAQAAQCKAAIADCVDTFGRLDVLINVAGKHVFHHTRDVTEQQWHEDLAVNVSGPFFLCQAAIPHLLNSAGNIVNVASIAGLQGQAYSAGYCAAKHGLIGLTRSLALEYTRSDLRVNAVCPGGMDTPQVQNIQIPDEVDFELLMRAGGMRGMMAAEEVTSVIAFLASDAASAVHGAVYTVDRGKTVG